MNRFDNAVVVLRKASGCNVFESQRAINENKQKTEFHLCCGANECREVRRSRENEAAKKPQLRYKKPQTIGGGEKKNLWSEQ